MNSGFYKDIDTNFEEACKLSEHEFSHDSLTEMLKNGNIAQKQIAAIKLDNVYNESEVNILLDNLTGCDGKIREAVAFKINRLLLLDGKNSPIYRFPHAEIFANAAIDINGNICRLVADSVNILKTNSDFTQIYVKKLLEFIKETFTELDKFIYKDKKYTINKQLFKLYWCLENLKMFTDKVSEDILYEILLRTSRESEYTIREKTAQIIVKLDSKRFFQIKENLKNDENYYVKTVFNQFRK